MATTKPASFKSVIGEGAMRNDRKYMRNDRKYKGVIIRECEAAPGLHAGPWMLQSYEHGRPVFDSQCRHVQTLAEARAVIDEIKATSPQA